MLKEQGILAHEVYENYLVQTKGTKLTPAHFAAINVEGTIHGFNPQNATFNEEMTILSIPVQTQFTRKPIGTVQAHFKRKNIKKITGN